MMVRGQGGWDVMVEGQRGWDMMEGMVSWHEVRWG